MSVKVSVEIRVSGIDDPEALEDALAGRDGYWRDELEDATWQACQEAGLTVSDTDVRRFWVEAGEPETRPEPDG